MKKMIRIMNTITGKFGTRESRANRISLLYPCYTLAQPLRFSLLTLMLITMGGFTTQAWAQLPYNMTMTSSHYSSSNIVVGEDGASYSQNKWDGGVRLEAQKGFLRGSEWNWDDKYVIIALNQTSIPYQLKFKFKCSSSIATNPDWYVAESTSKSGPWTNVWSTSSKSTSWSGEQTVNLSKSTKYIKLCYSGNYAGTFGSIKVTDQAYVHNPTVGEEEITSLDFGSGNISSGKAELSFDVEWCNVNALNVTSSNSTYFTVSPTSFGGKAKYGTQTITVIYDRDVAVGNHSDTITISNGTSTYTKTVTVSGSTTKRQQTIHWNADLVAVNYTLNAEDNLTGSAIATADNEEATITYTSGNSDVIAVSPDGQTLVAVANGKGVIITANATGNDIYDAGTDTKTFTVTAKKKQTITWEQALVGLKTNASTKTINLNATATSGGTITYTIEAGSDACITLSGTNNSVMTITGTPGEAYIIATQAGGIIGGEEWISATARKQVKVRDPNSACDEYALADQSFTFGKGDKTSMSEKVFNLTGKPTTLTFYAKRGSLKYVWSEQQAMYVEQYANFGSGLEWKQIVSITPGESNGKYGPYTLDETATKIRFRSGEYAEQNVTNISVPRKKELVVSATSITEDAERNVKWSKTISVSRSNIDVVDLSVTSDDASCPFVLSKNSIGTDCADRSTETFEVSFTPKEKNKTYTGTITITDGKANPTTRTINLSITTVAFNQAITWNFEDNQTFPSTNVPLEFDATTDATGLEVSYKLASGDEARATLEGNKVTFIGSGTIHVTTYQEGNDRYNAAVEVTKTINISAVTPTLTAPTSGTEIQYLQTLNNSTIANDGKATVTLRGEENTEVAGTWAWSNPTQVIKDNAGTHAYEVTFTPTDGGMYTTKTCTVSVTILRAPQAIEMKDGTVRVAVGGIDAGAADSKLDLDTLIKSQTSDVVNSVKRDGVVTYTVISDNRDNATIADGNIFSATKIGEYTIRATKAETEYYNTITADFKVTVSKRANTLTIAGTEFEKFVDDVITDICSTKNSDATVQTSSTYPTVARYDVESNKIVIPNSVSDVQMFGEYIMDTIKIWQEATERFEACEKTIVLTVKKYVTALNGNDSILKVNETLTANYVFTNTSAPYPSNNNEDDLYYTIDKPNFENEALNKGTELITYNPVTNEITGRNAGRTKITFFQKETYKYTGATLMHNISVEKRDNQISNSWNNTWQKAMDENATAHIAFSSTHGDYTNYPISIEQIYGADVATLTGDAAMASITTNTTQGYSIWHLSQAENYEYYAAEADVMVMVGVPAPPTCYVYEDLNNEHKFSTSVTDAEGHFESPIAINSPINKIWFKAKRQWGGFNYFTVQYSTDNGKTWGSVISPNLGTDYAEYSASFPTLSGDKRITHVRFGAKTGATLSKWYKDVRISRKAYLNILDAENKKISKLPTMTCTVDTASTAEAKFYIDYSTCADKIYIESSDTEHFTVSRSEITANGDNLISGKEEITVTYSSTELGTHNAVIIIRTSYQTCALSVSGETEKRTPTITWQENFTNNPLTLPVGLTVNAIKPAATTTSTALLMYESSDEKVIKIIEEGYAFKVVGKGTATLTAIVPENEAWKSISDSREINATDKVVQEIVWSQTFPRFMEPGNVIDLDAKVFLRNLSTDALTYSEERTQYLTYSCPLNNGIVSINGNKMAVLDYGEVKVTAYVGGNADYEAASMTVLITVRKPSVGCETPLVLNIENAIDMYEWNVDFSNYANLTTEEMISEEIKIDHTNGKPDKLSFQYEGEEFKIGLLKYFGGFFKFEQRVNKQWIAVEGSRVETVKNEWNAKSGLQLDENADALRIIREKGATGHHYIKNLQVTRKQYLRATTNTINLGEITLGQATPVAIGFDYSDIKGDLTARTINNTTDVTIKDNGAIDLECGSFGHHDLPIIFTPTNLGDWQGEVQVYDNIANLSITVTLTATVTANEEYIFNHEGNWNTAANWTTNLVPDENADITVLENMTINSAASVKSITIKEGATVTVKSGVTLVVGDGTPKSQETYGNLHVEDGAQVILKDGATLLLNDFTLDAALGTIGTSASSGQVENNNNMTVYGDAYFQLTLNPTGSNTLGWYDFVLPFEANISNGISVVDNEGNVLPSRYGTHYLVMRYDEAQRAVNAKDWFKYNGTMEPGRVYTIAVDADHPEWNTVRFKKNQGAALGAPNSYQAEYSNTGAAVDCGWNGLGNGTLRHMKLQDSSVKIQVYDHENNVFEPREAGSLKYAVGTSFFMQVDEAKAINFEAPTGNQSFLAPARDRHIEEFRLALTAKGEEHASDRLWVSASEEATGAYVIGHDLLKMGTLAEAKVAQMWANNAGNHLCDIEMPLNGDGARCELGLFAPQENSYTLSVEKAPEDVTLYLTYNDRPIWNLSLSPYVLDLTNGTTEGYGLQLYVRPAAEVATGVDEIQGDNVPCTKVLMDGKMYIITPEGKIYDATGKKVK